MLNLYGAYIACIMLHLRHIKYNNFTFLYLCRYNLEWFAFIRLANIKSYFLPECTRNRHHYHQRGIRLLLPIIFRLSIFNCPLPFRCRCW